MDCVSKIKACGRWERTTAIGGDRSNKPTLRQTNFDGAKVQWRSGIPRKKDGVEQSDLLIHR